VFFLFAAIEGLNNFVLVHNGVVADGDAGAVYEGSDTFHVESNGAISITVFGDDLERIDGGATPTEYDIDGIAPSITTTAAVSHNSIHEINATATLGLIGSQPAGAYEASFTITIAAAV
jgi:hypothetical protein